MDTIEYIRQNYEGDIVVYLMGYVNSDSFDTDKDEFMSQGYDESFATELCVDTEAERYAMDSGNQYAL